MEIDPRGPRVSALITTVVLAAVLVTGSGWLLAAQALVFAAGAVFGLYPALPPGPAGPGRRSLTTAGREPGSRTGLC